jgi:hypothetical protein
MTRPRRAHLRRLRAVAGRNLRLAAAAAVVLVLGGCVPIGVRVQNMLAATLG